MAVGPMLTMLWSQEVSDAERDNPLRVILAAPIPGPLHTAMEERWGIRFTTIYGLTEAQPMTVMSVHDEAVPGSAGKASPCFDMQIVDSDDEPVGPGQVGEIVCRPKFPHVMFEGYHGRAEATLAQFRNLWFHTGDAGYLDEDGNLFFVDRKKDAIRRRGENISSFELELAIAAHAAVAECAALPVPSPLGEDDVKICVVLVAGAELDYTDLMDHCVRTIPRFAVPRYIEVVESLPRNATGRVQKFRLRENSITATTWDRDAEGYVVSR
jgi:crotonobetaine/carnitine-CoA ligase